MLSIVIDTIGKRVGKKHHYHSLNRRPKNLGRSNRIINYDDCFVLIFIRYEPNCAFYKGLFHRQTRAVYTSVIIIISEQQHRIPRNPTTARPFFPRPPIQVTRPVLCLTVINYYYRFFLFFPNANAVFRVTFCMSYFFGEKSTRRTKL